MIKHPSPSLTSYPHKAMPPAVWVMSLGVWSAVLTAVPWTFRNDPRFGRRREAKHGWQKQKKWRYSQVKTPHYHHGFFGPQKSKTGCFGWQKNPGDPASAPLGVRACYSTMQCDWQIGDWGPCSTLVKRHVPNLVVESSCAIMPPKSGWNIFRLFWIWFIDKWWLFPGFAMIVL